MIVSEAPSSRVVLSDSRAIAFPGFLALLGLVGYLFAVRLPSLGSDLRLYSAFGDFVNTNGYLPLPGSTVGSDAFLSSYADFPALSLRIYQLLSLSGPTPNRFIWAAYLIVPLTAVMITLSIKGTRIGLSVASARMLAFVGLTMGIWTARFYEDKAHFLWLPILVFLLASIRPLLGAIAGGLFAGWTGLVPLAPFLAAIRQPRRRVILFFAAAATMGAAVFAAGSMTLELLQNRIDREDSETFWFGFWKYIPLLDNPSARSGLALLASALAAFAFHRKWLSFPAAFGSSAFFIVTSSASFQHTRIWMLLPLAVFLLPSTRWQIGYLGVLLAWSCVPLIDFLGYGYIFAGSDLSAEQGAGLSAFTNIPVLFFYGAFVAALWRGRNLKLSSTAGIFEPNAQSVRQISHVDALVVEPPQQPNA
jgi:hypothetical protein